MDEIIFLTNITSVSVYIIIFTLIFMLGYVKRALSLYNTALANKCTSGANFAWYPFSGVVTMAKLTRSKPVPAVVTSVMFFASCAFAAIIMLINKTFMAWTLWLCAVMYIIYGAVHFTVLKKYMNKFYPDVSNGYIAFACIAPFYKYLIHIAF